MYDIAILHPYMLLAVDLFIYLWFIWHFFSDMDYLTLNEGVISEWVIGKDLEGSCCGLI
jgi:hypothetical protein